ncbi:MAG: cysteine hydrolase [Spirochaetes bacterium]|nr:MAG: cysteine hydrolase [Spirochaetota bacterium]
MPNRYALMIVDMQRYYLEAESDYCRYFESLRPGSLDYILARCRATVIPNILDLRGLFRRMDLPVIYLRLCGTNPGREDLHRFFRGTWEAGRARGFADVYPLRADPWSQVLGALAPAPGDTVICKTTYSPFASADIAEALGALGIAGLVMTGLATSQCVETTARDASDRGFEIVHVEDAQADYDETTHHASLYSSRGVCGGTIVGTRDFIEHHDGFLV